MKKLLAVFLAACVLVCVVSAQGGTYQTTFPATEAAISEGGHWTSGKKDAIDYSDVQTTPGFAFGTQTGTGADADSLAVLTGSWSPNQTASATIRTVNQTSAAYEEVEIRLRSTLQAHTNTGYEINFRCTSDGSQYTEIVRIDPTSYTYVARTSGPGVHTGDVMKATIIGNVITTYLNGVQVNQGIDNTYTTGNPGIGFWNHGAPGHNSDFGFTSFSASNLQTPSPPTKVRIFALLLN
jgi:hypothetical protein